MAFGSGALLISSVRFLVFAFCFFGLFVCFALNNFSELDENVQAKEDDAKAARLSLLPSKPALALRKWKKATDISKFSSNIQTGASTIFLILPAKIKLNQWQALPATALCH